MFDDDTININNIIFLRKNIKDFYVYTNLRFPFYLARYSEGSIEKLKLYNLESSNLYNQKTLVQIFPILIDLFGNYELKFIDPFLFHVVELDLIILVLR